MSKSKKPTAAPAEPAPRNSAHGKRAARPAPAVTEDQAKSPSRAVRRSRIDVGPPPASARAKSKSTGKHSSPTTPATKRTSALAAAAHVLASLKGAESKDGITAPDLIERMAKAKLWTSPGGKTPAATLYAAMVREITRKGPSSRFKRVSPGRFLAAPGMKNSAASSKNRRAESAA